MGVWKRYEPPRTTECKERSRCIDEADQCKARAVTNPFLHPPADSEVSQNRRCIDKAESDGRRRMGPRLHAHRDLLAYLREKEASKGASD